MQLLGKKVFQLISAINLISFSVSTVFGSYGSFLSNSAHAGFISRICVWDKNVDRIKIFFLDGDEELRETVRKYSKKWMAHAGIEFEFVESEPADVRITFEAEYGASYVGTCKPETGWTMTLAGLKDSFGIYEQTRQKLVLHEFGHMLGFKHEHQHPDSNIHWNVDAIMKKNGQNYEEIKSNWLNVYHPGDALVMSEYDPSSIMHYNIEKSDTTDGYSVGDNCKISRLDGLLISSVFPGATYIDTVPEPLCCDSNAPFAYQQNILGSMGCTLKSGTYPVFFFGSIVAIATGACGTLGIFRVVKKLILCCSGYPTEIGAPLDNSRVEEVQADEAESSDSAA